MPLLEIASGITAKVAVPAARPLLAALLDVQDQQLQRLTSIEQDVRRLLEQPWRQARVLVAEANKTRDDDPQRAVYLNEARQALFQAYAGHPDVHSARAAIAAELSMVLGLLGRREDCHSWAATAHDEAVAVVTTSIPRVQAAVNRHEWLPLVEGIRDWLEVFDKGGGKKDFWADIRSYLTATPNGELRRSKLERFYEEGFPYDHAWDGSAPLVEYYAIRLGLDSSDRSDRGFAACVSAQASSIPGRQLVRLRQDAQETEEYRRVRVTLQPGLSLPPFCLRVNLAIPYQARLAWEPASSRE